MKLNWGTGIVIGIIAFISFILYFVVKISTGNNYDYDLVTEKYYQQELEFQKQIDAEKNALQLKENIRLIKTDEGLKIGFPKEFYPSKISGKIFLYRPSNKQLDVQIPIATSKSHIIIPKNQLVKGRWNISVFWHYNDTDYLFKKELVY